MGTRSLSLALLALIVTATSARGGTFAGCGTLVQGECLYFLSDDAEYFLLEDAGGFRMGDRVFVTGVRDRECANPCVVPCLLDNTIGPCFAGCGFLFDGPAGLQLSADDGGAFELDHIGGFGDGDRVYVAGEVTSECAPSPGPCLARNTIEPCFSSCGELDGVTQGCVLFVPEHGGLLALDDVAGSFPPAGAVYVSGRIRTPALFCFPWPGPGVEDNLIGGCFSECGTIVKGVECVLFETDAGEQFIIVNHGPFGVGDRVRIQGILDPRCLNVCQQGSGCVLFNTIADADADLTCDGCVGFADLSQLLSAWGPCPECREDLDGNGTVGFGDLSIMLAAWRSCSG